MSFEPVDIYINTPELDPVEGVTVCIYDETGTTFKTQASSDATGLAAFLLEPATYSVRFYKYQVGFVQPQVIEVLAAPSTNSFDIEAQVFQLPVATDARMCRCSGFFRDLAGAPKQYFDMRFTCEFSPIILDGAAVLTDGIDIRTNEIGYAQIDLIRGGNYQVHLESMEGGDSRTVSVPDLSSANLPDLLFPVVERVIFDTDSFEVNVGEDLTLTPTVYDSAGRPLTGTVRTDILWKSDDPEVFSVTVMDDVLVLHGIAAGVANLTATRQDSSIIRIPNTAIIGVPQEITVA
jgi:hypothetical protein